MRWLLVLASVGLCLASASSKPPPCTYGMGPDGYCNQPSLPSLVRSDTVDTATAVDGVEVHATPFGATGWTLRISNDTDGPVSVVWDESSGVASNGDSLGRLLRGETRKIDEANAQPPSPIAPHATLTQEILIEKLVDAEETESQITTEPQTAARELDAAGIGRLRAQRAKYLDGGSIYLVLSLNGAKKAWVGTMHVHYQSRVMPAGTAAGDASPAIDPTDDPAKASAYWCDATLRCVAEHARCGNTCVESASVWCAVYRIDASDQFSCATTRDACLIFRDQIRASDVGECVEQHPGLARGR